MKWVFEFVNEWSQLFGKYNWYTMTLVHVEFEYDDALTYGSEFLFIVLGLGFRIRRNTDKALRQFEKWDKEVKEEVSFRDASHPLLDNNKKT